MTSRLLLATTSLEIGMVNRRREINGMRCLSAASAGLFALSLLATAAHAQSTPPTPAPVVNAGGQEADASNEDATALAKKLQNPIGDLYSFPFQNNTNFDCGLHNGT